MNSEPSKTEAQDKCKDTSEPTTSVDVARASRDEGRYKSSWRRQPINRPIDGTNQSPGAASATSKSNSDRRRSRPSGEPTTFVDVAGASRDEGQSKSSSRTPQQPIDHPIDGTNQSPGAASATSKSNSDRRRPRPSGEPTTSVDVAGASRDEGQSKSSSWRQQPINRPIDGTNQSPGAASATSKSNSDRPRPRHSGGADRLSGQRRNRDLESRVDQLTKALSLKEKEHREELFKKEKEHREELFKKESELSELKQTLCLYDECSEVDIGDMVNGINTKIQSFARDLAMKWVKEASKASDGGGDKIVAREAEVERLKAVIGVQLVNALDNASPGQSTFTAVFLQFAWQASIVAVVKKILSFFSANLASSAEGLQIDNVLRGLSGAVREGEVQPAYGRWRLVTHYYLKKFLPNEEGAIQTYVDEALGFCHTASRLAMKNRCPDDESFGNAFQAQTKEIMEEAFKLLTTIQEKMATKNYEPHIYANGDTFHPETMAVSKQDIPSENDRVVCTVGLGMLYSRKQGREVTSEPPPKILFTKPQVLTEGSLSDMIAD